MEKIDTLKDKEEIEIEELFKTKALEALEKLSIPAFTSAGLKLARSDKEIAKCIALAEKAEIKKELKRRDAEAVAADNGKELTAAERRAKNKRGKGAKAVPGGHRKPQSAKKQRKGGPKITKHQRKQR